MSSTPAAPGRPASPGRYGLGDLVRAEWTKLRTVRSTTWTLAITVLLGIGISALAAGVTRAHWTSMSLGDRSTFDPTSTSLAGVFFGQLTIGVLGVLVVSAEYGTGTIRATFAAAPRRPLVLAAKVLVFGVVAFVVSEAVAFASFLLGQALLTSPAVHATLGSPGALRAVFGSGCYLAAVGLLALALASLVRHTAGAISAFVGVLLVLPLVVHALPSSLAGSIERFLPDHIGAALVSRSTAAPTFAPWAGFALLCAYTAVLLLLGAWSLGRRDA